MRATAAFWSTFMFLLAGNFLVLVFYSGLPLTLRVLSALGFMAAFAVAVGWLLRGRSY